MEITHWVGWYLETDLILSFPQVLVFHARCKLSSFERDVATYIVKHKTDQLANSVDARFRFVIPKMIFMLLLRYLVLQRISQYTLQVLPAVVDLFENR